MRNITRGGGVLFGAILVAALAGCGIEMVPEEELGSNTEAIYMEGNGDPGFDPDVGDPDRREISPDVEDNAGREERDSISRYTDIDGDVGVHKRIREGAGPRFDQDPCRPENWVECIDLELPNSKTVKYCYTSIPEGC